MAATTTVQVTVPAMGESVTEGTILEWHKQEGDTIAADETLVEISTDKVDAEVPAPASGTIVKIHFAEGDTVDVGAILAEIAPSNGSGPAAAADDADGEVEQEAERGDMLEGQEQERRRTAAHRPDQDLDPDEEAQEVVLHVARQPGADAHGKQVAADDGRELGDAVTQKVARQRARDQLVDEPAGRDHEHGKKQQDFQWAVPGKASFEGRRPGVRPLPFNRGWLTR
jgi:pyruvate/2-oxoglutarate dehydrogenase complex dihydrolipoamide acyltransferase (E2) component